MTLLRLLLLVLLGLVARHFFLALRGAASGRGAARRASPGGRTGAADEAGAPLTEQEISDADYEEIP